MSFELFIGIYHVAYEEIDRFLVKGNDIRISIIAKTGILFFQFQIIGMESKMEETETKGVLYAEENGERIGEMTFSKAGTSKIIIDHTDVNDNWKGFGVGEFLVTEVVKMAREKGIKIIPLCVFARSVFEKHAELRDVL